MNDLLIRNALLVNEGRRWESDILINKGRIEKLAAGIDSAARREIDADGKLVLPGMIDDQVHFREPGLTHKGDIESESRAAVAGGITSFMEMPNTNPTTTSAERLAEKYALGKQKAWANYAFYMGATNDNIEEIKRLKLGQAAGVKIFMGASTGNMLVDNPATLEDIFRHAPGIVTTHCEDSPMIAANHAAALEKYGDDIPVTAHPEIRSEEACWKSSSFAVGLAKEHGTRLHVLHLTTARELELFAPGPVEDKQITVEACVHHLFFDQTSYPDKGNFIKCNPAIKRPEDRQALIKAVAEGRIDAIATDHAPHTLAEKEVPYPRAAAGLPLVQDVMCALLELVRRGELPLEMAVDRTSHNIARRYNIIDRGFIREGYWADLVIMDTQNRRTVSRDQVLSRCGWSPFEGMTLGATVDTTVINGYVAYEQGQLTEQRDVQPIQFSER
ncbi:MAG: dihydroorotase [Pseudomonadota bacterium]